MSPFSIGGKAPLTIDPPILLGAGSAAFGDVYHGLLDFRAFGALVTAPVSLAPRLPAHGTHVVPLADGFLLHTGLPNPGLRKVLDTCEHLWGALGIPVVVHVLAGNATDARRIAGTLDGIVTVSALELGLLDGTPPAEAGRMVAAVRAVTDKPVLVRLPLHDAYTLAGPAAEAGAGALVVCGPPYVSARNAASGGFVSGRYYGAGLKPQILHTLIELREQQHAVPLIGAGGVYSAEDARDYLDAGAAAVQLDSVVWQSPARAAAIAAALRDEPATGGTPARPSGFADIEDAFLRGGT
jgi:dihydroorotate dehydrogenase (NAD+) catalytic subunit